MFVFIEVRVLSCLSTPGALMKFAKIFQYTNIHVGMPCVEQDYILESITPHQCQLRDMMYVYKYLTFKLKMFLVARLLGCEIV